MILFKRILAILFPILVLLNMELFIFFPERIILFAITLFILVVFSLWRLVKIKERPADFCGFVIPPLLFTHSILIILLFIENDFFRHMLALGAAFAFAVYLEHLFRFLYQPKQYQPYALENISGALNLISIFLITAAAFNFIILFNYSYLLMTLAVSLTGLVLASQTLWSSKLLVRKNWLSLLIITIVLWQALFVSYYLPTSPLVIAIFIATLFYILVNVVRHNLLDTLSRDSLRRYLVVGSVIILIIFLTARWS